MSDQGATSAARRDNGAGELDLSRFDAAEPLLVARGFGGRIELYRDRVRIVRKGLINYILYLMGGLVAEVETVVPIEKVSSVDVIRPIFWNDYLAISYAGAPPNSGDTLKDATAENALFLNFFDNRHVHDVIYMIERLASQPISVTLGPSPSPRSRRLRRRFDENGRRSAGNNSRPTNSTNDDGVR